MNDIGLVGLMQCGDLHKKNSVSDVEVLKSGLEKT